MLPANPSMVSNPKQKKLLLALSLLNNRPPKPSILIHTNPRLSLPLHLKTTPLRSHAPPAPQTNQILHLNILISPRMSSMFAQRLPRTGVLFNALHEILVCRPVHSSNTLDYKIQYYEGSKRDEQGGPPRELAAKVVDKGVADHVFADLFGIETGEDETPEEPAGYGDDEASKGDYCFGMEFEDSKKQNWSV